MPMPSPLVGLTVRAKVIAPDNTPIVGATVTLTPTVPARSPAGDVLITAKPRAKTSAADGTVEWTDLLATDSPGLSNRVPYTLLIVEAGKVLEGPILLELLSSQAVAGVLRLDDVAPATPAVPLASYVLQASVGAVGGPAGPLDATGKVPASQLPAAGGSIPATIVDAKGDLVTATAADTPARFGAGSNGQVLTSDSAQSTGLRWASLTIGDVPGLQTALDGKVDEALLDAAGDLVVATAADIPARLPVGTDGQVLVVDTGQAGRLKYADRIPAVYPPAADGLIAVSAPLEVFEGTFTLGAVWYVRMLVPAGKAITNCVSAVHAAGTLGGGGENGMAVYTDAGVLVAQTASDNNLWTTTGPKVKALTAPIAAQAADRYVYVGIMVNGYSGNPFFMFIAGSSGALMFNGGFGSGKRRVLTNAGSSSAWSASFNPATDGGTGAGFMPFLALS